MPDSFLHERSDFKALVATVADTEKINDPALVEKDYWIMHAVFRHYSDIHQLLDVEGVQKFIVIPEYLAHKEKRFKSLHQAVAKSGAFTIEDENVRKQFEVEYLKTAPLYYRGHIPFDTILPRIQRDLVRL